MAKKKATKASATKRSVPAKKVAGSKPAKKVAGKKGKSYWLVKSEPHVYSIDDLASDTDQTTHWDGVRNYQARNTMRDEMKKGDLVLFYHSNAEPPGIAGIAKVVREGYPDHTAFDPKDKHYDPKSKKSEPTWYMVDVQLVEKFKSELALPDLKQIPELEGMVLLQRGSRLSVQPVQEEHFKLIRKLGKAAK